ncbi:MAG TPA: hypothetical protein DCR90_00410 [Fusobacteriaceae bacterium]|nr:hypothetical protein [Fusobacteriaceae bacterium]
MKTKIMKLTGLGCGKCKKKVEEIANNTDGISKGVVSLENSTLTITFENKTLVNFGYLKKEIIKAGYGIVEDNNKIPEKVEIKKDRSIKKDRLLTTEIIQIKEILAVVKKELKDEGLEHASYIETGIMVEVPSTVFLIDKFSKYVDFFSLGTNDLTQYVMAADRLSADVAYLNDYFEPAVLRAINYIAEEAIKQNKKISVCGEMANDPMAILTLMSFGIERFSMLSTYIPMAKRTILRLNSSDLKKELKPKLLNCNNAREVKKILKDYIEVITVENDRS